ncbi:MAG: permease-like cell division protein FtsX [Clostridia bacterium]
MRYNVVTYLLGEGFRNIFKNKKSTAASLMIMCAAMLIFGIFFVIGKNVDYIMTNIEEAQGMEVFIKDEATEEQIQALGDKIRGLDGVHTVVFKTKEEALNQMKERLKDKSHLLAGFDENNIFPASYVVTLTDLHLSKDVQNQIMQMEGVKSITSRDETVTALINIANGIRIVSGVILVILIVISIFIISNTIKLTVHARRREISIMKYVGATNSFIRWPFIVEGIIIGIIAGMLSVLLVGGLYSLATTQILKSSITSTINLSLLSFSDLFGQIVLVYSILGIGIGVLGSWISMRKYLKV